MNVIQKQTLHVCSNKNDDDQNLLHYTCQIKLSNHITYVLHFLDFIYYNIQLKSKYTHVYMSFSHLHTIWTRIKCIKEDKYKDLNWLSTKSSLLKFNCLQIILFIDLLSTCLQLIWEILNVCYIFFFVFNFLSLSYTIYD